LGKPNDLQTAKTIPRMMNLQGSKPEMTLSCYKKMKKGFRLIDQEISA